MSSPFERRLNERIEALDMVVIANPNDKEAEAWLASVNEHLDGMPLGLVRESDCPEGKRYVVNRDYYKSISEQPWKAMGHVE